MHNASRKQPFPILGQQSQMTPRIEKQLCVEKEIWMINRLGIHSEVMKKKMTQEDAGLKVRKREYLSRNNALVWWC